ncbi:MAG: hypothetical protein AAF193_10490, partial [Bacteroidota bacterium]
MENQSTGAIENIFINSQKLESLFSSQQSFPKVEQWLGILEVVNPNLGNAMLSLLEGNSDGSHDVVRKSFLENYQSDKVFEELLHHFYENEEEV